MDNIDRLHQLRLETWQIKFEIWSQGVFTFRWWVIAAIILAFYAIWIKLSDKRRLVELLLFGSLIAVVRVVFDNWGISTGRWTYALDIFPLGYSLFLNDLTVVPLSFMLVYQYSPTWKRFLLLSLIAQGAVSFILLPFLKYLGILVLHNWKLSYSFIILLIAANVIRAVLVLLLRIQQQSAT